MDREKEDLVLNNLKLVHYCVRKYIHINHSNQDYEDYYQEGCLGLCVAANKFDMSKGFKFSSYAASYIHGYLLTYKNEKMSLIKYPRSRISNRLKISLYLIDNPDTSVQDMLINLNLSMDEYVEAMSNISYFEDYSNSDDSDDKETAFDPADPVLTHEQLEISDLYNTIDNYLDKIKFSENVHINNKYKSMFTEYIYDIIYLENSRDRTSQEEYANKYNTTQSQVSKILNKGKRILKEILDISKYK